MEWWDNTWNCQAGRLVNEDYELPWERDDNPQISSTYEHKDDPLDILPF